MTDRARTLLSGRRERIERVLGRPVGPPMTGPSGPMAPNVRRFLLEEVEDLYWNELEWENITDEESLEDGSLAEMAFPGFMAFIRGLLLSEVMPDALAPASPRPEVVEDALAFLCARIVELEEAIAGEDDGEQEQRQRELQLTSRLVDLVLYRYHELTPEDIERIESERRPTG